MHQRLLPLLLGAALLAGCNDNPRPPAEAPAPAPIMQNGQLRFTAGHPQLKLLGTVPAEPARAITIELPAKLVWNEERTQRIFPAFAGRVSSIRADVGQRVGPGSPLAVLASPEFGQAQSETARAEADERLSSQTLQR